MTQLNSLAARDAASVFHPYTDGIANEADGSLIITGGNGITVTDENGRNYIEGMAGLWCTSLGFGQERLANAAAEQIRKLSFYHGFNQKGHEPQIELAERLLELSPVAMSKVLFANSGSEANDTAVKLIWYRNNALGKQKKKKIIGREKAYHGVTIAAASITGTEVNHQAFDLPLAGFLHADCPHFYRYGKDGETVEEFATRCADNLDAIIEREDPATVAAFFAEPVMGAGGVLIPPATYFDKIQAVLKKHDVLLVVDEVICGFGRTGNWWGSQTYGLSPDIITCAKALSSGYMPISAIIVNETVFRPIAKQSAEMGTLGHGFTYSGHPVAAAVAIETLKIYDEIDLITQVRASAPVLQNGICQFDDHPMVGEISGVGLLAAVELVADKTTKEAFHAKLKVGQHLIERALGHGLIIRALGNRIAFSPPLIIKPDEITEMFARFAKALEDTWDWVKKTG